MRACSSHVQDANPQSHARQVEDAGRSCHPGGVRLGVIVVDAAAVLEFLLLADLDLHRHPHIDLLTRSWKLRENVTAHDAMYVALAEALEAPIVTCDRRLARAPG